MSAEERQAVLAEVAERFASYDPRRWQLEQRIERLKAAAASDESEGGEPA